MAERRLWTKLIVVPRSTITEMIVALSFSPRNPETAAANNRTRTRGSRRSRRKAPKGLGRRADTHSLYPQLRRRASASRLVKPVNGKASVITISTKLSAVASDTQDRTGHGSDDRISM